MGELWRGQGAAGGEREDSEDLGEVHFVLGVGGFFFFFGKMKKGIGRCQSEKAKE